MNQETIFACMVQYMAQHGTGKIRLKTIWAHTIDKITYVNSIRIMS